MTDTNNKNNIVFFIATRPINPNKDGRTMVFDQYCKVLHDELGFQIHYACFDLKEKQPNYIQQAYNLKRPGFIEVFFSLLFRTFIRHSFPIQTSLMYCRKTKRYIKRIADQIRPDVVIVDMVRLVPYISSFSQIKCLKILNMDELISKRYYRQLECGKTDGTVLGQFREKIPNIIVELVEKLGVMPKLLKMEAKLVEKREKDTPLLFDKVFFVSPVDMKEFENKTKNEAHCVHISANEDYISEPISNDYDNRCIGYIGNIDSAPGKDSLHYLIEEVILKLRQIDERYHLLVIGKCSESTFSEFSRYRGFVDFTFYVDSLIEYARSCCVIAIPVLYGSGIKTKVIQSLSMGMPVITNTIGAEGLSAGGDEITICYSSEEYIQSITQICNDPDMRNRYAKNGREYVLRNHSRKLQIEELKKIVLE